MKRFSNKIAKFMAVTFLMTFFSGIAFADSAISVCHNLQVRQLSTTVIECLSKANGNHFDKDVVDLLNDLVYRGITTEVLNAMDVSSNKTYNAEEIKFCHNFMIQGLSTTVVDCLRLLGRPK